MKRGGAHVDSAFCRCSGFMTFGATSSRQDFFTDEWVPRSPCILHLSLYFCESMRCANMTAASAVSSKNDYAALCTQIAATPLFMPSRAFFAIRRSLCAPHRMRDIPEGREAMFLRASAARRPKCPSPDLSSPLPPTFVTRYSFLLLNFTCSNDC